MQRNSFLEKIDEAFKVHQVVALLGPRQSGKTTLANQYVTGKGCARENFFDLENIEDISRLSNPKLALEQLEGIIVIDEIQLIPDLFKTLRVLVDHPVKKQKYLILGSASRDLIMQSSETLAGRIEYIMLPPFSLYEVSDLNKLWLRGGFPRSYLADSEVHSFRWRDNYIKTFLERDIPNLGIRISPLNIRRFWMMLSHYHGNICNYSELGKSLGLSRNTIKHYIDILNGTFMVRILPPWFENISKRQVKSPKIYFTDSGILHNLLGINNRSDLVTHPKLGASWEGFALEEVIRYFSASEGEYFFWSTQNKSELDLLIVKDGKKYAFEIKYTDNPKVTKSLNNVLVDLGLEQITIIYPGDLSYNLSDSIRVSGLNPLVGL